MASVSAGSPVAIDQRDEWELEDEGQVRLACRFKRDSAQGPCAPARVCMDGVRHTAQVVLFAMHGQDGVGCSTKKTLKSGYSHTTSFKIWANSAWAQHGACLVCSFVNVIAGSSIQFAAQRNHGGRVHSVCGCI